MSIFTGAGVALITPFKEDLSVDYDQLEKVIDFQIQEGTDSIIICGTTGEASTMTHDEQIEVVKACVDHVNGRVPVIAGAGANCTDEALHLAKEAQRVGSDALLVVTPYYNKATQNGLVEYYKTIGNAVDVPIIMYNVPGRTGTNIAPKTAAKVFKEVENVVAIKEASGNLSQVADIAYETEGQLDIYSGNDDQVLPVLSLGGKGVISVLSNIAPKATHEMVAKYLAGDVKGSTELQIKYLDVIHKLFTEVNPVPVKRAMAELGYCRDLLRRPLTEMEESNAKELIAAMKEVHIL
ncbi:MAG: 4-hydroxy-tetrahydrodipicolinate synthase [Anaerostipes sp.]|jgi:4-hydroxy-tetrahydrodipicolinate synthase|nr:4-hydroxy-tetrahydrodipicolinate synthase [Anaerostipes sp.]